MKQNITLAVDKELLKKARVLAAKRETSISKLLSELLAKIMSEDDQYEASKKRALSRLKKGFHLGGRILATRDELHERK
jgi:HSP90 family molecular chaperone